MALYAKASQNLKELEDLGCTIVNPVDVMTMAEHRLLQGRKFDRIIYNFPHAGFGGRESDFSQIQRHRDLVRGFLQNAKLMLSSFGEIHITHKTTYPFTMWYIEYLASCEGLRLVGEVEFDKALYPGYENKRGSGLCCDQSFFIGKCSTFKFSF
ncbi:Heavy metal-associated isoprenylated plant protein [Vigna angularis]|nr:heavy metal-associated isoprenylated plant protein 41-like [Vigna angularis]KAG2384160.1 Heavy metal-associated isoprenylated plant protein [Vigna angularis]